MKRKLLLCLAILSSTSVLFTNCDQVGQVGLQAQESSKLASTAVPDGGDANNDPGSNSQENYDDFDGNIGLPGGVDHSVKAKDCLVSFKDQGVASNQQDMSVKDQRGSVKIASVRNLILENIRGSVRVDLAANITSIYDIRGSLRANAIEKASKVDDVRGSVCLSARNVETISNARGSVLVSAQSVESIENVRGSIAIYKAQVRRVANIRGSICLYQGAQIQDLSEHKGVVQKCD